MPLPITDLLRESQAWRETIRELIALGNRFCECLEEATATVDAIYKVKEDKTNEDRRSAD